MNILFWTALIITSKNNDIEIVKLLLEYEESMLMLKIIGEITSSVFYTAQIMASKKGHTDIVSYFLKEKKSMLMLKMVLMEFISRPSIPLNGEWIQLKN